MIKLNSYTSIKKIMLLCCIKITTIIIMIWMCLHFNNECIIGISYRNIQETVYTDILTQKRLLGTHGNKKGNVKNEFNKDILDSVKNIKYQEQCSLKNDIKYPLVHKGDENNYKEEENCTMNDTNEYKTLYKHIGIDTQGEDKSSKNKNKKKFFLFKLFIGIDFYFERIIFNVFTSIDKISNSKSSNKLIPTVIAITKICLVLAIPILFIVMACLIVLKEMNKIGDIYQYNYIYILFISIGIIMIIYLLIKVLKYSRSTKKNQLYSNNK